MTAQSVEAPTYGEEIEDGAVTDLIDGDI